MVPARASASEPGAGSQVPDTVSVRRLASERSASGARARSATVEAAAPAAAALTPASMGDAIV